MCGGPGKAIHDVVGVFSWFVFPTPLVCNVVTKDLSDILMWLIVGSGCILYKGVVAGIDSCGICPFCRFYNLVELIMDASFWISKLPSLQSKHLQLLLPTWHKFSYFICLYFILHVFIVG